ncbi:TsoY family (seleno)protein [Halothiobacillus sp. DCM-1]|uniref:TsoY family (seleno)protein n=1 Tax=Halothiobacillus sp. DCM-1 TaxID=3112558 RepID=UPI003253E948
MPQHHLGSQFSPLYFLAALGAGGLSVSLFIYLMFLVPHPDTPLVTFHHLAAFLSQQAWWQNLLVGAALMGIAWFAFWHFQLLWWNLREFRHFRNTDTYQTLLNSNAEISLMAIPLTLAMSVNVLFVLGALFIPHLWQVVEWLFPLAIAAFLAIGIAALRILLRYFARILIGGSVDFTNNNSLSPMISLFALSMIAVGLAAPAAMSQNTATIAVAIALSLFFFTTTGLLLLIKLINGFGSMMASGIRESASPSLWIMIPILTLLGITTIRLTHGLHHGFDNPLNAGSLFVLSTSILSAQILFGLLGYIVMQRLGYFHHYLRGEIKDAGSFALICPGVALFVFGMFFIHVGLVHSHVIDNGSVAYFTLMLPFILIQLKTFQTFFQLRKRLLIQPAA